MWCYRCGCPTPPHQTTVVWPSTVSQPSCTLHNRLTHIQVRSNCCNCICCKFYFFEIHDCCYGTVSLNVKNSIKSWCVILPDFLKWLAHESITKIITLLRNILKMVNATFICCLNLITIYCNTFMTCIAKHVFSFNQKGSCHVTTQCPKWSRVVTFWPQHTEKPWLPRRHNRWFLWPASVVVMVMTLWPLHIENLWLQRWHSRW